MKKIIFIVFYINILIGQIVHEHSHEHNNEFGVAFGIVPGHENEGSNLGLHLHYIKGMGTHNDFGIGLSLETIFDEHKHNSISLIGLYHFRNGFTTAFAPGILFTEHNGKNETQLTHHLEFYYEFELENFHIGPQFDIGIEDNGMHYMIGIHLGVDF